MDEEDAGSATTRKLEDDLDALFKAPWAEFITARNNLAAQLKRDGSDDDAKLVKALAKPSVSAWAVNQLYFSHREEFDRLFAAGRRFRQAQTSRAADRIADVRESLDARRESLSRLSELATELLRDAGHNFTPDTIHRIITTLEALSAYATPSDGPTPGRLTRDVDPPGFESFGSLIPGTDKIERKVEPERVTRSEKSDSASRKTEHVAPAGETKKNGEHEETHRARLADAKASLQEARRSLTQAQSRAERLEAAQKKAKAAAKEADVDTRQAEKQLRQAEERFKKASAVLQDAADRAQRIAAEAEEAERAVEDAKQTIERASKKLESLTEETAKR